VTVPNAQTVDPHVPDDAEESQTLLSTVDGKAGLCRRALDNLVRDICREIHLVLDDSQQSLTEREAILYYFRCSGSWSAVSRCGGGAGVLDWDD
jgi:hypothetical protein